MVVLQSLAELASEGDFCGAIVTAANCGNIKGQVFPVFDLTHVAFYVSLLLKF